MNIIFKADIPGYEGLYEIDEFGHVYRNNREIKSHNNNEGYRQVTLCKNGIQKKLKIHRLVASAFVHNPNNYNIVDHIDRDRSNNHFSNLRWVTKSQNTINSKKRQLNYSSSYKGVCFNKQAEKFCSYITLNNKRIHIGYFDTEEEAAIAYNEKALEIFGEFACLNEIENPQS